MRDWILTGIGIVGIVIGLVGFYRSLNRYLDSL